MRAELPSRIHPGKLGADEGCRQARTRRWNTVFLVGVGCFTWFLLGLVTGWSYAAATPVEGPGSDRDDGESKLAA
ncbi:MAG: hypothetical protein ACOCXA_05260 [Planctomycetota bacterium]